MRLSPTIPAVFVVLGSMVASAASTAAASKAAPHVLTAKRLIETHQLDGLSVNPAGTHAVVGVKRFSFENNETTSKSLVLLDVPASAGAAALVHNDEPTLLSTKSSEAVWLSNEEILYVHDKTVYVKHVSAASTHEHKAGHHGKHVGILPATPTSMRVAPSTNDGEATLVFSAEVYADGDLTRVAEHDQSEEVKRWSEVKVYDSVFVRHWDKWLYPGKRTQLFSVDLRRHGRKGAHATWSFASHYRNLLNGTALESPVAPFGDAGDYDVSTTHVAFTARDPAVNAAWHTKHNIYTVPLDGSEAPTSLTPAGEESTHGASASPRFSPKGKHLVWLQMHIDGYEADRNRIVVAHVPTNKQVTLLDDWTLSPSKIGFSKDGKSLVGVVENWAQGRLFTVALHRGGAAVAVDDGEGALDDEHEVVYQTEEGVVSEYQFGADANSFVFKASSMQNPGEVYVKVDSHTIALTDFTHAKESPLTDVDLGPAPEHITYAGANGRESYAWLYKPPGFDASKTASYPLLMLAHGGPESAWANSWGRRWNVASFAAQGYVCIAINPAGSTGYGQAYTEEILGQMGGAPFEDVMLGTKHILDTLPAIDATRVVGAGASYGGFMMAWLQGHNDEGLFKGLVCHDGIFSIQGMAHATEELYFPEYEFGGSMLDPAVRERALQWSPERFAHKWETPMLIIHGGRDYRLTDAEGLSMFNVLQRKGIKSRLLYFPDESHWVLKPKNSLKWHEEVFGWLKTWSSKKEEEQDKSVLFRVQHAA